jgi:predicted DsbA family dithiol-disulfide isomerase
VINVEIYSDVVCPWCYIGKRRWEQALAALAQVHGESVLEKFNVVFRPYQLDPTAPAEPSPVLATYAKKFGGEARAREIMATVTEAARGEGLLFKMDIAQRANTQSAHRLLEFARVQGVQEPMKERLMRAYFTEGIDIGHCDSLVSLATDVGLSGAAVKAYLHSNDGVTELHSELQSAAELGISAVPTFVFNGEFAVPGAQDPEVFVRLLTKLLATEVSLLE